MKQLFRHRAFQSMLVCILAINLGLCSVVPSMAGTDQEETNVETETEINYGTIEPMRATAGISAVLQDIMEDSTLDNNLSLMEMDTLLVGSPCVDDELLSDTEEESSEEETPIEDEPPYTPVEPYTMYVGKYTLRERTEPNVDDDTNIITCLYPGTELTVIGTRDDGWVAISSSRVESGFAYVSTEYIQDISPEEATYNYEWQGEKLNSVNGRVAGPSGNETYYNMDMSYIVERLHSMGYEGEYWVRSDGVKMFGDYVMVAAAFDIRPIGTLLPMTLGTGIVCDTGDYINWDYTGLDVATTW